MTKFTNPLNNIKIASPCSADWNEMMGNERRRFCPECKLNVYNLSGMSQREAENLLLNSEGRLCVRFYKRADGTILTKDCPVGWQAIRQRVSKLAKAFASLVFAALSGIGLANYFVNSNEQNAMGEVSRIETPAIDETAIKEINSNVAFQEIHETPIATMGVMVNVAVPKNNKVDTLSVGKMTNLEAVHAQIKQHRKR